MKRRSDMFCNLDRGDTPHHARIVWSQFGHKQSCGYVEEQEEAAKKKKPRHKEGGKNQP